MFKNILFREDKLL